MAGKKEYSQIRRKIIAELLLALSICLSPFLILVHLLFDELSNNIVFWGANFTHVYVDNQTFAWHVLNHLIPFLLLIIIFFTSGFSWRRFMTPLIILYIISIFHAIFPYTSFGEFLLQTECILLILILIELFLTFHYSHLEKFSHKSFGITRNEIIRELLTKSQSRMNEEIEVVISSKNSLSKFHYTCKLYHLHTIIEEYSRKHSSDAFNKNSFKYLNNPLPSAFFVVLTLIFFISSLLPSDDNLTILGIEIGNYGFLSASTFLWYFLQKIVILGVLGIWFLTSKAWWKWAIFTPVIFYLYQLWDIFHGGVQIEETQNLITSPFVLIIITFIFFVSAIIHKRNKLQNYYLIVQEELKKGIYDLSDLEKV